jgi:ribosome modulation factor
MTHEERTARHRAYYDGEKAFFAGNPGRTDTCPLEAKVLRTEWLRGWMAGDSFRRMMAIDRKV